jgi:multidrug efflux pump subunit AcrA (membrane-fusion protein)
MARLNFSRQVLPIVAVIAIIAAIIIVWRTAPDRTLQEPVRRPATAPAANPVVAGAGVVEPASELIEIGAEVPGVVDRVWVRPGDTVPPGAPLFSVDSRAARAGLAEAEARVERLRSNVAAARTALEVAGRQYALYQQAGDPRAVSRQEVITRQGAVDDARAALGVAQAQLREGQAQARSARVTLDRHVMRAPKAATVLQVRTREGEYAPAGQQGGAQDPLVTMGVTDPLHVRIDIDESEIARVRLNAPAVVSPRGAAAQRTTVAFVRAEPLVVPKRSLTNSASERVDVRVLQLIYALPRDARGYFVGQQVDGFVPAAGQ